MTCPPDMPTPKKRKSLRINDRLVDDAIGWLLLVSISLVVLHVLYVLLGS